MHNAAHGLLVLSVALLLLDNHRGIILLSIPGKVFSMLIGERLKAWVDEKLLDASMRFQTCSQLCECNLEPEAHS